MPMQTDDILLWPDGSWCLVSELAEFGAAKSDDFVVIPFGSEEWERLSNE